MKIITAILIIILFSAFKAEAGDSYWIVQQSPVKNNFTSCFFTDSTYGWIAGDSGVIIHTSDNGADWNVQITGIRNNIYDIFFVSRDVGFAIAWELDATPPNYYGSVILSTTNGGMNWNAVSFPDSNVFLNSVFFRDPMNGYLAGSGGSLYYTSDGGIIWNAAAVDSGIVFGFPVRKIKFFDNDYGLAVGGAVDIAGIVWKSTNGGRSWRTIIVGPEPINDFTFLDNKNALGVGGDFEYGSSKIESSDGGSNWLYSEFQVFGIANTIAYRTQNEAWVSLGIVDSFLVTTNGGASWELTGTPLQSRIYRIVFPDRRNGWAVGNDGIILKYNSSLIGIENNYSSVPENFILYQNYPNPFNPETSIRYDLRKTAFVTLKIFDIRGNEIGQLVNEIQRQGSYNIKFKDENLPSGIYYCRLTSGNYSETKKMMLIK
ncbi:MAG: T9SS type A sorting domain-containing protein [Bacteroidetes bacterium]|nr:T9SS type A sorting domain-containing protein [Bacteroidota bacterium]